MLDNDFLHLSAHELVFTYQESGGISSLPAAQQAARACAALATMAARGNDERYADLIDAGAIEALLSCLDAHGLDDVVALHGLTALHAFTKHSSHLTAFLIECGAYTATLQCIPYHVGNQEICETCTLLLLGLLRGGDGDVTDANLLQLWASNDGWGSALESLCYTAFNVRQPRSAAIAVNVCTLLSLMLRVGPAAAVQLARFLDGTSFVALLAEFIRIHFANSVVVVAALRVLIAFGEADTQPLRDAVAASAEAVLKAVALVLGKTYSYAATPATWTLLPSDAAEGSLVDDMDPSAASPAVFSADHQAIVFTSLRVLYLVTRGLRAVPPLQRTMCTPSGAAIAADVNYVKMGQPSAATASLEHRLLLAVTCEDVLPLYTVVATFIRLNVFRAMDAGTGAGAGAGATDLAAACVDAFRAISRILQSLDPRVVNARHIFRVRASLDDQNVPALLRTLLSQTDAPPTVFTSRDVDGHGAARHAAQELLDSWT